MTELEAAINLARRRIAKAGGIRQAFDQLELGFDSSELTALIGESRTGQRLDDAVRIALISAQIAVTADRSARFPSRYVASAQMTLPGLPVGIDRFSYFGEQIRSARTTPHWRELRIAAFARAHGRCEGCDSEKAAKLLQLHHITYVRLGHESLADVELLCDDCHRRRHNLLSRAAK